ncbi:carboxylesterase family protein [Streptomyces sp. PTM05]|uniref:Carboxylic ester hydrolase n=1 Tax=Streptantibioticus parmotrematis TaxID=2873249 RepID=A0ABS7QQA7_9ACTN|nr:carboxylesterase family protein [Streptantibioticus parmotrematis]MBY8885355.1 carboxylesterase family protein [Streptantibioticus parmotrematis]
MTGRADEVVDTGRGRVRGAAEGPVIAFRGVPYAASPVGDLRFAPPRPHPVWSGVREAVRSGPAVPQAASRLERVMGPRVPDWDEDGCLTVNVWTPRAALEDGVPRPVLVWFHGGGFTSGSGGWDWYDGGRLAALGDMVVVTANYRLGPLGYLHLPQLGAENLGSQDQAAALRWVRETIASFGGDPGSVTVGGQSAGAYSALSLAVDPRTTGLVHRVLLQSGPWGLEPQDPGEAAERADAYLSLLGVSDAEAATALRALPVEQLLSAYGRLSTRVARPGDIAPPMHPVLGGPGVPRSLRRAVADGALVGKDLLIGTTRDEATAFFGADPRIQGLTTAGALDLLTGRIGGRAAAVYEECAARLPGATPAGILTAVETDEMFRDGAMEIADHQASGGDVTYVYRFDRRPPQDDHGLGATHCAELPFLFTTFDAYPDSPMLGRPGDAERDLGLRFAGAVARFVTNGSIDDWPPYAPTSTERVRHLA